jgi:hypothetical protein
MDSITHWDHDFLIFEEWSGGLWRGFRRGLCQDGDAEEQDE